MSEGALRSFSVEKLARQGDPALLLRPSGLRTRERVCRGCGVMAIYHLQCNLGSRKTGQSARAKCDYIWRAGPYRRDHAEQVRHMASGNMPAWARRDPAAYWAAADIHERANGTLFREIEFALPLELDEPARASLAERFAADLTDLTDDAAETPDDARLPWSLAIHAGRDSQNPHCHLLLSERRHDGHDRTAETWFRRAAAPARRGRERPDPASGGAPKVSLRGCRWLLDTRERWARMANEALQAAGETARIDQRSYAEQGIDLVPGLHMGPAVIAMEERGIRTERGEIALTVSAAADEVRELIAEREELTDADSDRARPDGARPGRPGERDRAAGPGAGGPGGRDQGDPGADPDGEPRPGAGVEPPAAGSSPSLDGGGPGDSGGLRGRPEDGEPLDMAAVGDGRPAGGPPLAGARDRIVALAEPSREPERGRDLVDEARMSARPDRTRLAVERQLAAMGQPHYQIGISDQDTGQMMERTWTEPQVLDALSWLKRQNARGANIYIRPDPKKVPDHDLILVDDLDQDKLDNMRAAGHDPALVVETSPANYHAWIKLPEPQPPEIRLEISRRLTTEYGGDENSIGAVRYGRLAGLTNRKPIHETGRGLYPFVLLRQATGRVAAAAASLVQAARDRLEGLARQQEQRRREAAIRRSLHPPQQGAPSRDPVPAFRRARARLTDTDASRADFTAGLILARQGYSAEQIGAAIEAASPELAARKTGHEEDYVRRTVAAIMEVRDEPPAAPRKPERDPDDTPGLG